MGGQGFRKPLPIVAHAQGHTFSVRLQADPNFTGFAMFDSIGDSFLRDAIKMSSSGGGHKTPPVQPPPPAPPNRHLFTLCPPLPPPPGGAHPPPGHPPSD